MNVNNPPKNPRAPGGRRPCVLDFDKLGLAATLANWGEPAFRTTQLWRALYERGAQSFDEMTTLPRALRRRLGERFRIGAVEPVLSQTSADGLVDKVLFRLDDGELIETVLMRYEQQRRDRARRTVCISTQAGCALGCTFCATGQQGFRRNLSAGEIVAQVLFMNRVLQDESAALVEAGLPQRRVTNVVFMGMGEPLANYRNTMAAVATLNDAEGVSLGARHMTISTAGLAPQIRKLASEPYQVNLAVSLHAADDDTRSETMPVNRRYPIATVLSACRAYIAKTNRRVSFEYVLLAGQNDHPDHAHRLAGLLHGMLCHVNLIPVNRTAAPYDRPDDGRIGKFRDVLRKGGVPVTVRFEKGTDIDAGCGQLRAQNLAAQRGPGDVELSQPNASPARRSRGRRAR